MTAERLYIVSSRERQLYEQLKHHVASDKIGVILDRRQGERRVGQGVVSPERRRRERRVRNIDAQLQAKGWAVVYLREGQEAAALKPGDRVVLHRFNPLLPRRLLGKSAVIVRVNRLRAVVRFDGEAKTRIADLADLFRVDEGYVA